MTLEVIAANGLHGTRHGFFTRRGGASSGVFDGLNCGYGSSDQSEIVAINRDRVAAYIGVPADRLLTVHQIHSSEVVHVTDATDLPGIKADAMVTDRPGLALAVLTADCQPVLFADPETGVIGSAHAGWLGALDGILEATIDRMVQLGARRDNIRAAIGPAISQRAYEVGQEYLERFLDTDPDSESYFANGQVGKYQFDLIGYGLRRLRNAGIHSAEWTGHCTYSDPNRFFSYRRSVHNKEADYGRLISAICL